MYIYSEFSHSAWGAQAESENSAGPSGFRNPNWDLGIGMSELVIDVGKRIRNSEDMFG